MKKKVIEIQNITKSYDNLQVLKGISLAIDEAEIVTIVGPSGAGKSTLLHIIGTLDRPNAGSIIHDGIDISEYNDQKLSQFRNEKIGFIFQFHHLLPEFTALENVCMPMWIKEKNTTGGVEKAKKLLALMGLESRVDHKPSQLSGGEQQRVAIARAMMNDPKVILADEPSGNLDSVARTELHNLFFTLRKQMGICFVIVTHDDSLADMADRSIKLKDGLIVN